MRLGRRAVPGADLILLQSGAGRSRPRTALVPRNSEGLDPPEGRRTLAAGCCHASWAGRCWNESRSSRRRSPAGPRNSAVARPLRARRPAFAGLPCGCCGLPSSEGARGRNRSRRRSGPQSGPLRAGGGPTSATAPISTPAQSPAEGGILAAARASRPFVPTDAPGAVVLAGRAERLCSHQPVDLMSTGAPPARR
jgi:hypothetical protein